MTGPPGNSSAYLIYLRDRLKLDLHLLHCWSLHWTIKSKIKKTGAHYDCYRTACWQRKHLHHQGAGWI